MMNMMCPKPLKLRRGEPASHVASLKSFKLLAAALKQDVPTTHATSSCRCCPQCCHCPDYEGAGTAHYAIVDYSFRRNIDWYVDSYNTKFNIDRYSAFYNTQFDIDWYVDS